MKVLIVEDDQLFADTLVLEFEDLGFYSIKIDKLKQLDTLLFFPTHAIVDLRVGVESGLDFVVKIKEKYPECRIIMMTGFGTIATAVEAVKRGADEYLTKPVSLPQLLATLGGEKEEVIESLSDSVQTLARKEREYIEYTLSKCDGNISKTAKVLGLHRQSLQRKLKKYPPKN